MRPDSRRATALVVFLAVLLLGLVAEWVAYGSHGYAARGVDTTHLWVVDLATGVVFLVSGLVAATRRPASRVGPLLVLTAIAWFAGTLQEPRLDAGTALLPSLLFLYRGPLAHLVMTFPSGRASDGVERLAVLVGYSVALLAPPWLGATSSIALVALFAAVAGRGYLISRGPSRRARRGSERRSPWPSRSWWAESRSRAILVLRASWTRQSHCCSMWSCARRRRGSRSC